MFTAWRARRKADADARVLGALGAGERSTHEVLTLSGLSPTRCTLALHRLEAAGRVWARWDTVPPIGDGPRRRLYRLSGDQPAQS